MDSHNRDLVEQWWADLFDVERDDLWRRATVHDHTTLGDHEGWYAAWRDGLCHVSAPASADQRTLEELASTDAETLSTAAFWASMADSRELVVVGPAVHAYLDEDPGDDDSVPRIDPVFLGSLRAAVDDVAWEHSGFAGDSSLVFGCVAGGELVAASRLSDFAGAPRDIGVLVRPDHRGRGLGHRVAGAAASYAIRRHGLARWRAADDNPASRSIARELGFEDYAVQLALRASRA